MTNTTKAHDTAMVAQVDRDAAADAVKAYRDQKNGNWQKRIRNGECDDGEMVQAFTRHRTTSQAELLEALEAIAAKCRGWNTMTEGCNAAKFAANTAAATIARIKGEQS